MHAVEVSITFVIAGPKPSLIAAGEKTKSFPLLE